MLIFKFITEGVSFSCGSAKWANQFEIKHSLCWKYYRLHLQRECGTETQEPNQQPGEANCRYHLQADFLNMPIGICCSNAEGKKIRRNCFSQNYLFLPRDKFCIDLLEAKSSHLCTSLFRWFWIIKMAFSSSLLAIWLGTAGLCASYWVYFNEMTEFLLADLMQDCTGIQIFEWLKNWTFVKWKEVCASYR